MFHTFAHIPDNVMAGTDQLTGDCIIYLLLMHLMAHPPMGYSSNANDVAAYPKANPVFSFGHVLKNSIGSHSAFGGMYPIWSTNWLWLRLNLLFEKVADPAEEEKKTYFILLFF